MRLPSPNAVEGDYVTRQGYAPDLMDAIERSRELCAELAEDIARVIAHSEALKTGSLLTARRLRKT